jgi:hypothetical protein
MQRRLFVLPFALAALSTGVGTASAAPAENASCVAHFVHGDAGPPGLFQSEVHVPRFGERVSEVARLEGSSFEECLAES